MRLWVQLLVAALALAGCTGDTDHAGLQDDYAGTEESPTENPTSDEDAPNNEPKKGSEKDPEPQGNGTGSNSPPTANLTADIVNGTAPLNVTFTVASHDEDGDALTWNLSINGTSVANGSSMPATVMHAFDAGNHTALLVVYDGRESGSAELDVTVAAGPTEELVTVWKGTVAEPLCVLQGPHSVSEDLWGMEYRVVAGWEDGMYMDFWDEGIESQTGAPTTQTGTIPKDTANAWLCMGESTGLRNDYTIEIWG